MPTQEHDLIVIGAGPGGYIAAIRAAQLGLNVACVDDAPVLGGTCLRIGCIPSKALLESSEKFLEAKESLSVHGILAREVGLDLSVMQRRKEQVVAALTRGVEALFKKNKVTRYNGRATLDGAHKIKVTGNVPSELKAKHILLATGSRPEPLSASAAPTEMPGPPPTPPPPLEPM